jgi:hypothetical protein
MLFAPNLAEKTAEYQRANSGNISGGTVAEQRDGPLFRLSGRRESRIHCLLSGLSGGQ